MDLPAVLPHIPKVAGFLLIIVGGFIVIEFVNIIKNKLPKKQQKQFEDPNNLQPLKFPYVHNTSVKKPIFSSGKKLSPQKILLILMISIIVISIGVLAYYLFILHDPAGIFSSFSRSTDNQITTTEKPDVSQPSDNYDIELLLYVETENDQWKPISKDELSSLSSGNILKIAVKTTRLPKEIEILVNDKEVPIVNEKSPLGYNYATFTIPEGKSEFHIAARAL